MDKKRSLGGLSNSPFLIAIIPLNSQIDPKSALAMLKSADPDAIVNEGRSGTTHITYASIDLIITYLLFPIKFRFNFIVRRIPRFKQRFAFILPPTGPGNELAVLDCLKVCDTTILLISAQADEDEIYDKWGKRFANMAIAQGIPTPVISLMDLESIAPNRRAKTKIAIQKFVHRTFPVEKVMCLDTNSDAFNLFRRIGGQKLRTLQNRENRPHLFAEAIEYVRNEHDENVGTLKVTGDLRGQALNVNHLVHIPGLGDFQMSQIDLCRDSYQFDKEKLVRIE